jgi:D-arabinose 1-dehydrogenase-like Zn-dependent alcohol dehydrogenase
MGAFMAKMRVAQIPRAKGAFEIVEREIPQPDAGSVRIKVEACGVCHSDSIVKEGLFPGIEYPRVPGHELIGVIDAVGSGVKRWKVGQRVGVGWNGGYCGYCDPCRRGEFFACQTSTQITGITRDGGYGQYTVAPAEAVAFVPEGISAVDGAPLLCAGVTTFNALRNSGARPGDVVAVLGLGGLGHLAVQYAAKMGARTVAIARGKDKASLARELGAMQYIDSQSQDPAAELTKLGGASVIMATITDGPAMTAVMGGLGIHGTFMLIGAPPKVEVPVFPMITGSRNVRGWYSGVSIDSQDTLAFSAQAGVKSMNEVYPLDQVEQAYERMISGKARFRVVLKM